MIARVIRTLRPICVCATVFIAVLTIASLWGFQLVSGEVYFKLLFSYGALVFGSVLVCWIEGPVSAERL
jgi:hypothetical protein